MVPTFKKSKSVIKKPEEIVSHAIYGYTKAVIDSGQGSFLFDVDGNRYIDFAQEFLLVQSDIAIPL
jgi:4-aminobutyrate aminotransferase-like enzyme